MIQALVTSWALLTGMFMLMVGNGIQSTLLGIRGDALSFSTLEMSIVMSAYFVGFLGGSRMTPELIRRVGHVRVFAALASFISAILILYPAVTSPWAWMIGRVIIGFCFSGVYVTAESWLNDSASNENRGKSLSLYMIFQMAGIVLSQYLFFVFETDGYILFVIASVLVSLSFAPILLSISPVPAFETTKPMTLRRLYEVSPTSLVGMFLMGGVFSAQFGMAAVFGTSAGLTVAQISLFVSATYIGALLLQFPIGFISDQIDRRMLILICAVLGGVGGLIGFLSAGNFTLLLFAGFVVGGVSNPLYALLIAYTNDYLDHDDMAAASGGLIFVNGLGAIAGPLIIGWLMNVYGPYGFFIFLSVLLFGFASYVVYRMTQRNRAKVEDQTTYAPVFPTSTPIAAEVAQEVYIETELDEDATVAATGNP